MSEFEQITAGLEDDLSPEAIWDECKMYIAEDPGIRVAVINKISELTGVKTGGEVFSDG